MFSAGNSILCSIRFHRGLPFKLYKSVIFRYFTQDACCVLTDEDRLRFYNTFPQLKDLICHNDTRLKPIVEHLRNALEYNVHHGQKQIGLLTVVAYKTLNKSHSENQLIQASIMGWCAEMLKGSYLISDDIADNSVTRWGQLCWHRKEDIGLKFAVNDIALLENLAYQLLSTCFRHENYYSSIIQLFQEISLSTLMGQFLDIHFSNKDANFNEFSEDNFNILCEYKTSLYLYYLPIALAMNMVGIKNLDFYKTSKDILINMAKLHQMKDDYLDCFGNPEETGKIGTDIQEGKCSWLIVNALKLMNENETRKLLSCYGKEDNSMIKFVVDKYEELGLKQLYSEQEKTIYDSIVTGVSKLPENIPSNLFHYILRNTYKRENRILTEEDRRRFSNTFSHVVKCLASHTDTRLKPVMEHWKYALEYNVPFGHKRLGLLTIAAYKILNTTKSEEQLFQASIMGWAVELLKAAYIIVDDIVDNSLTRRGRICWYRKEDIGLKLAFFDGLMMENLVYKLMGAYFCNEKCYTNIIDLLHKLEVGVAVGHHLEFKIAGASGFTDANYNTICYHKAFVFSYYLPVSLALTMSGVREDDFFQTSKDILIKIGKLFQMRNDYLDCFGSPDETGKIGTDISEGKCTWFIVNALKLADENGARQLLSCYGKKDESMIQLVIKKFLELNLDRLFLEQEKQMYDSIVIAVNQQPANASKSLFHYILATVDIEKANFTINS